jgi:hypothetical protein
MFKVVKQSVMIKYVFKKNLQRWDVAIAKFALQKIGTIWLTIMDAFESPAINYDISFSKFNPTM